MKNTDKHWIRDLAAITAKKGISNVVLSPGSRCAPLVIAFNRQDEINCHTVIDERCAAFYALGMAQQTGKPVALVCTSGTALLNYAPALAEAYYQNIPLVVFSADRPKEWIDQGDGQSIRQYDVFKNFIKNSFELPNTVTNESDLLRSNNTVNEALNLALEANKGPVHINCPFKEPLYDLKAYKAPSNPIILDKPTSFIKLNASDLMALIKVWNEATTKMVVAGSFNLNEDLIESLNALSDDDSTIVLTELTSNLFSENFIHSIDPAMDMIEKNNISKYQPELLVTFGGNLLSKKLKVFLRNNPPKAHWHIDAGGFFPDTFKVLNEGIKAEPEHLCKYLADNHVPRISDYKTNWLSANTRARERHDKLVAKTEHSDLTVFKHILDAIPANSQLQLGNSTPVRYAALFEPDLNKHLKIKSNRGVSGIDGCLSTAVGVALASNKTVTVIVGDLSFFYDSNAFWGNNLPATLKVIVVNNGGGNIFRIINGPSTLDELEERFETPHNGNIKDITKAFGLKYLFADDTDGLKTALKKLYQPKAKGCTILEVKTDNVTSAEILKNYLNIINQL